MVQPLSNPSSTSRLTRWTLATQHFNFGHHQLLVTSSQLRNFWLYLYIAEVFYPIATVLIKISILLFLYRIFHLRIFQIWAIAIGIIVISWGIATVCPPFPTRPPKST